MPVMVLSHQRKVVTGGCLPVQGVLTNALAAAIVNEATDEYCCEC